MEHVLGTATPYITGGVILIAILLLGYLISSRYHKVGPNEAMLVSGRGDKPRVVKGGGTLVWPVIETAEILSLDLMTIPVRVDDVSTLHGVPVSADGTVQLKIGGTEEAILTAAEQFLGKTEEEIKATARLTLEGHLRAILGKLSVEDIYQNRESFGQQVQDQATTDLTKMGLVIVSFTIKDLNDKNEYLVALGRGRIAEVVKAAAIAESDAKRETAQRVADNDFLAQQAQLQAQAKISDAQKMRDIQKANNQAESDRVQAMADLAGKLAQQETLQQIAEKEGQVALVQVQRETAVAEQKAALTQKQLDGEIRAKADAEAYRITTLAQADLKQAEQTAAAAKLTGQAQADVALAKARADAEAAQTQGLAQAEAVKAQGLAQAEITQAQGQSAADADKAKLLAQADGERARLLAQAEGQQKLADANAAQGEIMLRQFAIQAILDAQVKMVEAIAQPMGNLGANMKVIDFGGGNGADQSNPLFGALLQTPEVFTKLLAQAEALTGMKPEDLMAQAAALVKGTHSASTTDTSDNDHLSTTQ